MIQLKPDSICVQLHSGESLPLLAESVVEAFCESQQLTGGLEPWQVEQIAQAIIHYLRQDLKRETIEVGEFLWALSTLTMFVNGSPGKSLSGAVASADLYRLAQDTGYGFELAFFQSVERSIQEFRSNETRIVRFVGLHSCVKLLVGAKSWGRSCQRLSDEIVFFIRSRMHREGEGGPIAFAVS